MQSSSSKRQTIARTAALALVLVSVGVTAQSTKLPATDTPAEAIGPTYNIIEPDMLEVIEKRLKGLEKSGEMAKLIAEAKERSLNSVQNPIAVEGLGRSKENRTYYFDPSVAVTQDIRDTTGRLIVKAGTRVNPFEFASLTTWILFFDATDPKQVALAERVGKQYDWNITPVLVAGSPLELQRKWKRRVYFDQGGTLVNKMGIQNVPALVTQERKEFRIDELRY